jgi:hypothetical protein
MVNPNKIFGRLGNLMFQGAYIYTQMRREMIPDIYLQSDVYFKEYADEIKQLYGSDIGQINKVAIHVRRGDYVRNPFYVDLSQTDYYEKAIAQFPNAEFLVFSDDIPFCEDYFIGKEYEFCEETDEVKSLNLMASCKGVIIANSSFSWWGGYLSKGTVVAPLAWFTDGVERVGIPNDWIRV